MNFGVLIKYEAEKKSLSFVNESKEIRLMANLVAKGNKSGIEKKAKNEGNKQNPTYSGLALHVISSVGFEQNRSNILTKSSGSFIQKLIESIILWIKLQESPFNSNNDSSPKLSCEVIV